VARIGRALEVFDMARDTCGRCKVVVIVDMTISALPGRRRVHASQRKTCSVVIEGGIEP
jgi:hypothetical protein